VVKLKELKEEIKEFREEFKGEIGELLQVSAAGSI
jgi:hypothetical protein